jgi:hypothetical protein
MMSKRIEFVEKDLLQVEPRPSVMMFARMMELTLRQHDASKGGQVNWRRDTSRDLVIRANDEMDELCVESFTSPEGSLSVVAEAVDVANFQMMICDQFLQFDAAVDQSPKPE